MARRVSSSRAGFLGFPGGDFVSRVLIPAAIVLFWAGMMTHLVTREIVPGYVKAQRALVDPDILLAQWQPIQEWAWIKLNDARVGGTGLLIDKRYSDPGENAHWVGYVLAQNTHVNVSVPGASEIPVTARIRIHLTKEFHIDEFSATVSGPAIDLQCRGFIQASRLYYRFSDVMGADDASGRQPMVYGFVDVGTQPLDLTEAVKSLVARHGSLRVGERYQVRVFNPLGGSGAEDAQVVVAGEEYLTIDHQPIQTLRLETKVGNFPVRRAWVDTSGVTQRRELAFGYMTERGGAAAIREEYPVLTMEKNIAIPEVDRRAFIRRAEVAGSGEPDGAQAFGMLGAFLQAL